MEVTVMAKKATKKATKKAAGTKKATKKAAAPKKATKKVAAPKKVATKRKPNPAFMKAMTPSKILAEIVGDKALPRTEAIKRIWDYIKKNALQNPSNRRNILADGKLKELFSGKKEVSMFELATIVGKHLS
jgi:upstream activation factor subunit UAF30